MLIAFDAAGKRLTADTARPLDISIPLRFSGSQPNHFGAARARSEPLTSGAFVGDTRRGGSCNAEVCTLTPHCNGTHTECVAHVTDERITIREIAGNVLVPATLVSVDTIPAGNCGESYGTAAADDEPVVSRAALEAALAGQPCLPALVIRTLPNAEGKRWRQYAGPAPAPFFTLDAIALLVDRAVQHLLVDLPSLDRSDDGGLLAAHRVFWGLPPGSRRLEDATRADATVTELVYVAAEISDGEYLLNLQIPPFDADAAPSRPVLYALEPT